MWRERIFYRDVWMAAQGASGLDIRPHECRHSYVSHLRAASVDDADLAEIVGHRVETMLARYTHSLRTSFPQVRRVVANDAPGESYGLVSIVPIDSETATKDRHRQETRADQART